MHFLKALSTEIGAKGFVKTAADITDVIRRALESGQYESSMDLGDDDLAVLLKAAENRLVLAITSEGNLEHAGPYNAVDLGRWIVIWLASTARINAPSISEDNFQLVRRGMSKECKQGMVEGGVVSAAALLAKVDVLDKLAVASTHPPPHFVFTRVLWPCVVIHLCEAGQILRDIPGEMMQCVLASGARVTTSAVQARTTILQNEERGSLGCHAVLVTQAALEACVAAYRDLPFHLRDPVAGQASSSHEGEVSGPVASSEVVARKRPAAESARSRVQVLKKPAMMATCSRCGAEVREDVIARHMGTPKCKRDHQYLMARVLETNRARMGARAEAAVAEPPALQDALQDDIF